MLSALRALDTPSGAIAALNTTLHALQESGTGMATDAQPPPQADQQPAPADALAALLAQCSLEATRRLAAAEAKEEEGGAQAPAVAPMVEGDVVCEACGGGIAASRLAAHRASWCPGVKVEPPAAAQAPPPAPP